MKKVLLFCAGAFLALQSTAQVMNGGFEQLRANGTAAYWLPNSTVVLIIDSNCFFQGTDSVNFLSTDAHTGGHAYEIRVAATCNGNYAGSVSPSQFPNDTGFVDQRPYYLQRPQAVTFYYKLASPQGDYGYVAAAMEDSFGATFGTVSAMLPAAPDWTAITLSINYNTADTSGFLRLKFTIQSDSVLHYGTHLLIDDVGMVGTAGIAPMAGKNNALVCYPNPVGDELFIAMGSSTAAASATISVSDAAGRALQTAMLQPQHGTYRINTAALPKGVYFLQVRSGGSIAGGRVIK